MGLLRVGTARGDAPPMSTEPFSLPRHDTPVARLRAVGPDALHDTELLALVLDTGGDRHTERARTLLATHEGLRGVARAGLGSLAQLLGERRAARVVAAFELSRRAQSVPLARHAPYRSSRDVVRAYGPRLADAVEERVLAVVLDARQRPVAERVLAYGSAGACPVSARQVFALAVREGGTGVLLVHNHPSGDPTPSPDDMAFTRQIARAGALLDVPLLDHVIVARDGSFSFLDAGILGTEPQP